jgi:hypothetical protein
MKRALVVGLCSGAALSSTFAQELYDSLEPIENVVRMRINRDGSVTEVAGGPSFRANSSYYDCTGADYRLTGSVPRWHGGDICSFAPENPGVVDTLINLLSFGVVVPSAQPETIGDVVVRLWNVDPSQCNPTNGLFDTQIGGVRFNDVTLPATTGGTIFFFNDIAIDDVFPADNGLIFPTDTWGVTVELRNADDTPHALWTFGFATNLVNPADPLDPANCVDPLNQPLVGSSFVNATPAALYLRDADGNGVMTSGAAACPAPPSDIRTFAGACPAPVIANLYLALRFDPPPVAAAGPNQTVTDSDSSGDESVTLDGSASTDDTFIDTYTWTEGATEIGLGASISATFTVGSHTVTLTVADEFGVTSTDDVTVTVNPGGGGCPCAFDTNGSGTRDLGDLAALLSLFGSASSDPCIADSDGDGLIGLSELAALLALFGSPC